MQALGLTLLSTLVISAGSLAGILTLLVARQRLQRWLLSLVALSAGTMLGAAMFHLLPEVTPLLSPRLMFGLVTGAFVLFFLVEKVFHWSHRHEIDGDGHALGWMNLIGDSLHNLIDGLVIGSAYAVSISLGLVTSLAVLSHEIPHEIGDFGVLLHSGWTIKRAVIANFLVSATSILGGVIGLLLASQSQLFALYLTPIAAGGFIYIAASDLIPELRKEKNRRGSAWTTIFFIAGLLFMAALVYTGGE